MIERDLDGIHVLGQALPEYPDGGALFAELADIAAPAIGALIPSIQGSRVDLANPASLGELLKEIDASAVLGAIGQALGRLGDKARFQRVTGELLRTVSVELEEDGKVSKVDLNSPAKITRVIRAGGNPYARLGKLLAFALEVNFGPLFGGGSRASSPAPSAAQFREG